MPQATVKNRREADLRVMPGGERRLVLRDVAKKQDNKIHLTLSQILLGEITVTDEDADKEISLAPLTLRTMAAMKQMVPNFDKVQDASQWSDTDLGKILACVANQGREDSPLSVDEVMGLITVDNLEIVRRLLVDVIRPTEAAGQTPAANLNQKNPPIGAASSTSSPNSSAGVRKK